MSRRVLSQLDKARDEWLWACAGYWQEVSARGNKIIPRGDPHWEQEYAEKARRWYIAYTTLIDVWADMQADR